MAAPASTASEDRRLAHSRVRGTPRDTEYINWRGVVFKKVGTAEEAGLSPDAFPRRSGPLLSIDGVELITAERAKRFKQRRKRST